MLLEKLREIVWKCNLELPKNGLVKMTSGNVSGRDPETGLVVIKPSGVSFEELTPANMVVVNLEGDVVEGTLNGNAGELKEYTIGAQALERGDSFDPRTDPIVRAEASRLRTRLALYYATEGLSDAVAISLPKGSYVPVFETRTQNRTEPPRSNPRW